MKELLQKSLKAKLDEADQIEAACKQAGRNPTADEMKTYNALVAEAEGLKTQIDTASKREALKDWGDQSAGSVVKSSFDRMVLPNETDNLTGIAADPTTGEMYAIDGAYKGIGQKKLEALKSGGYKDSFADYVRNMGLGRAMKGDAMKVLNEGLDTAGGFWLPPDFRAEVVKRMAAMVTVRKNASVYTTGMDQIVFPSVNYTGGDLYTTGATFSWRNSLLASDISETTNPVAGQERIPVHLATCAIIVQREQLEDNAFDILGYLSQIMAETFSLGEESAYTTGNGIGQPQGFAVHPSASIANGSTGTVGGKTYTGGMILSGDTDDIAWGTATTGIIGVEAALPPQYEAGAKWYANKKTFAQVRALNAGTATLPQWSLGDAWPNYGNNYQASLLGYGIEKNQFMADYGASPATPPMMLGDLKGYYIADRVGLSVEVFREVYGLRDQVIVYARKRTGGQLVHYWRCKFLTMTP